MPFIPHNKRYRVGHNTRKISTDYHQRSDTRCANPGERSLVTIGYSVTMATDIALWLDGIRIVAMVTQPKYGESLNKLV